MSSYSYALGGGGGFSLIYFFFVYCCFGFRPPLWGGGGGGIVRNGNKKIIEWLSLQTARTFLCFEFLRSLAIIREISFIIRHSLIRIRYSCSIFDFVLIVAYGCPSHVLF